MCLLVDVSHHLHQDQQGEQPLKWCVKNGFELIEWTLKDQKACMCVCVHNSEPVM